MVTTVYYCASSLDGYIAEADDSLEWLLNYEGAFEHEAAEPGPMSEGGGYERFYEGVGALVAGSITYEWILDHLDVAGGGEWPYRGKPCWVLSSRELRLPEGDGVDVRIANAPVGELYGEMAAAAGDRVLWVVGGGGVASQFADEGLVDDATRPTRPSRRGAAGRRRTGRAATRSVVAQGANERRQNRTLNVPARTLHTPTSGTSREHRWLPPSVERSTRDRAAVSVERCADQLTPAWPRICTRHTG